MFASKVFEYIEVLRGAFQGKVCIPKYVFPGTWPFIAYLSLRTCGVIFLKYRLFSEWFVSLKPILHAFILGESNGFRSEIYDL